MIGGWNVARCWDCGWSASGGETELLAHLEECRPPQRLRRRAAKALRAAARKLDGRW